jgi:hypothetical protein
VHLEPILWNRFGRNLQRMLTEFAQILVH